MQPVSTGTRPLLVLDVGGLLLVDPIPILFDRLAEAGLRRPRQELYDFYRANLRHGFWDGAISEDELWAALLPEAGLPAAVAPHWHDEVMAWQTPMPAIGLLERWGAVADLQILSNHRTDWIRPLLANAGVEIPPPDVDRPGLIRRALVSQETRLVKPDRVAFEAALAIAPADGRVLFVDDQPGNVKAAIAAGLPAILASTDGSWTAEVDRWLTAVTGATG